MKKFVQSIVLMLTFSLLLYSPASADTITAMAMEINPEHLEKTASYARILGYDRETDTLTVELISPETFRGDEVAALQVGDGIYTGGREVTVESILYDDDFCRSVFINDYDVFLFEDRDGNFTMMADEDDCVWNTLAVIECPVRDSLLFLDYIDEETGDPVTLPAVHTAKELTARLLEEDASQAYTVGLSSNNVYVVFDGDGSLAAIHRFYVPWQ